MIEPRCIKGACGGSKSSGVKASPLAAGAAKKNTNAQDGTGWEAHSCREVIALRLPGAMPPEGSSSDTHEQGQDPGADASQPGNAESQDGFLHGCRRCTRRSHRGRD